jgi:hypothetical protein
MKYDATSVYDRLPAWLNTLLLSTFCDHITVTYGLIAPQQCPMSNHISLITKSAVFQRRSDRSSRRVQQNHQDDDAAIPERQFTFGDLNLNNPNYQELQNAFYFLSSNHYTRVDGADESTIANVRAFYESVMDLNLLMDIDGTRPTINSKDGQVKSFSCDEQYVQSRVFMF